MKTAVIVFAVAVCPTPVLVWGCCSSPVVYGVIGFYMYLVCDVHLTSNAHKLKEPPWNTGNFQYNRYHHCELMTDRLGHEVHWWRHDRDNSYASDVLKSIFRLPLTSNRSWNSEYDLWMFDANFLLEIYPNRDNPDYVRTRKRSFATNFVYTACIMLQLL